MMTDDATAPAEGLTIRCKFERPKRGRRARLIEPGTTTDGAMSAEEKEPPIPTIARSLVRAHAYENLIRSGAAKSYADVAGMVRLTTARLCQMAALLNLDPSIQAEILDFVKPENRALAVDERLARKIAGEPDWSKQREAWRKVRPKQEATTGQDACPAATFTVVEEPRGDAGDVAEGDLTADGGAASEPVAQ